MGDYGGRGAYSAGIIKSYRKAIGQNWATPETLSFSGFFPLITLSDQGTAVATWIDSVTNILTGSRNLFLFTLMPPSNFVGQVIENISSKGTSFFLTMSWNPSPAPNIVSYEIFQNGILIATIPGSGPFTFVQPLTSRNIQGTYTLVAIASNGNRSIPISLVIQPAVVPPSDFVGKVIKNEFLTETAYFLKMHWNPSPAPNIVSYQIFKNGKLIEVIPGNGPFKFLQPLHSKHVKGDYILIAIASDGSKSFSVPLVIKKK